MRKFTIPFLFALLLFACKSNSSKPKETVEPVVQEVEATPEVMAKSQSEISNFALLVDTQNAEYVLSLYLPDYDSLCNTGFDTIIPRDKCIQIEKTATGIRYRITTKQENGVNIASPYEEYAGVKLFTDGEDNLIVLGENDIRDSSVDGDGVIFRERDVNYIQIDTNETGYDEIVIISSREVNHYSDGLTPHCN